MPKKLISTFHILTRVSTLGKMRVVSKKQICFGHSSPQALAGNKCNDHLI